MRRLALVFLGVFVTGWSTAQAADSLRFSLWLPPTHPITLAAKAWTSAVNSAGSGKVEITLHPAQELGNAAEHYDLVERGEVDIALINFGYDPDRLLIASLALLPFTIRDSRTGTRAIDEWYRIFAPQELSTTLYCLGFTQDPGTLHSKIKMTSPDQLHGLKVRVGNAVMARYFALVGAKSVFLPIPDVIEAVTRDEFDAMTFSYGSFFLLGLDRSMHHHIDIPLYTSFLGWVINRDRFNRLSSDAKRIISSFCTTDQAGKIADQWAAVEIAGRERMRTTAGHTLHDLDAVDLAAWRYPADILRQQSIQKMIARNMDYRRIITELDGVIKRRNAAF